LINQSALPNESIPVFSVDHLTLRLYMMIRFYTSSFKKNLIYFLIGINTIWYRVPYPVLYTVQVRILYKTYALHTMWYTVRYTVPLHGTSFFQHSDQFQSIIEPKITNPRGKYCLTDERNNRYEKLVTNRAIAYRMYQLFCLRAAWTKSGTRHKTRARTRDASRTRTGSGTRI